MRKARPHQPLTIPNSRWLAYAGASAATALAVAPSADGEIHYSGRINARFRPGHLSFKTFQLDQPGDNLIFGGGFYFGVEDIKGSGSFVGFSTVDDAFATAIRSGGYVSAERFANPVYTYGRLISCHCSQPSFVGFRFRGGRGPQYGWARVQWNKDTGGFQVIDYAYADPGEPIKTGQTSSSSASSASSEGSLGLLAIGGAGLFAWRKRRSESVR